MTFIGTPSRIPPNPSEDEELLLQQLRAGDEAAFERLVRTTTPHLLAVARRFFRSEDDAQDALQSAFLSAFKALPTFQGGSKLSTWLHRIVVNACLMKLRSARRSPTRSIDDMLPRFLADGHHEKPVGSWKPQPESIIEREQMVTLVRACIEELPEQHREVLMLRDIQGLDTEVTADYLGISISAVKTRLHRARLALRELLDPHMQKPADARREAP